MKKQNSSKQTHPPQAAINPEFRRLKLGIDEHTGLCMVSAHHDHGPIGPGRKMIRGQVMALVAEAAARGEQVHTVQESCGFAFGLQRALCQAGARTS